ncbi:DUF1330 domain-containing protein [Vibrio sp. HN007]|uniref:DUF1330 domain-containing protein n=1 Tax=Vibrio iocasae TaxID=3098914 RepID=UPI0035D4FAE5
MPAYMMAFVRIENADAYYRDYASLAAPIVEKHGGKPMIRTENIQTIEGAVPEGLLAMLEFPTIEQAQAFYADPDYQPLIKVRQKYSSSDAVIFEKGFEPSDS